MGQLSPQPPDDEDRRPGKRAKHGPELPPLDLTTPLGVVIPDDLTGLEDEIRAVQLELGTGPLAANTRRARLRRWLLRRSGVGSSQRGPSGLGRSLLVGPIVAMTLLVVAGLVALFPPPAQHARRLGAPPRLASPTQPIGAVGGLLPDVRVSTAGDPKDAGRSSDEPANQDVPVRGLRPAVLMLMPDGCACPDLVHQLVGQVEEYPGVFAAVIGSGRDPALAQMAQDRNGGNGRLPALVDHSGELARTYHAESGLAPTLLFVAPNGILTQPPLVFRGDTRIEGAVLPLVPPVVAPR